MDTGTDNDFEKQIARLRAGDVEAIGEFVARYESYIRRSIRFRLQRFSLQPVADSVDVCQSVMGSVLLRLVAGEFELHCEEDLRRLLIGIAQKKFLMLARRESAAKRARSRTQYLREMPEKPVAHTEDPSHPLILAEVLSQVAKHLSSQEAELFRLRREGLSWGEISLTMGEEPVVLRKRLSRACEACRLNWG